MYQAEGRYIQKTDNRQEEDIVKLMKYYLYRASGYAYINVTLTLAVGKVGKR